MKEDKTPPEDLETTRASEPGNGSEQRIGNYRILQKVGEGGMGEVYEAEQERPVRRRVALKVIKHGMDTKQVVARFEAERQALAMMDHPAVAKVFEAGATPRGRPYFVMEFVRGVAITEHCDRQKLPVRERLELFLQVCEGVQHAHQNAIIHRDLKPSNVLVSIQDGRAVPKIIDFGVAKATTQKLTEKTMFTELGVLIGTPEYMSPEQAEGTGQSVDTRTDVYSLGVMLYELLVGALPFDPRELRSGGYEGIRKKIREEEPPRPSARLSTLGDASTESARSRRVDLSSLQRQLRGDLDWITMRALEKDRTRRYGSPQELAADIGRYLTDQPVLASPPSTVYRTRKLIRRHRLGVTFAATAVVFLVAFAARERIQSRQIANERDRANSEADAKGQVSDFLFGLFEVLDPSEARGNTITVREILDRGAERIDEGLNEQPLVQARLMDTIGQMYQSLGLYQQAGPLLENALRIRRSELGDEHLEVADSLAHLGSLRTYHGAPREVMSLQREALGIREKLLGIDHVDTGWSLYYVGSAHLLAGDLAEAEAYFYRALAILELEPDGRGMSWCLNDLGLLLKGRGDYAGAASFFERSLEIKERSMAPDHPDIGITLANLAFVWAHLGQDSEAESYFTRAMSILENAWGADHPMVPYMSACYFAQIGRHTEALQHIRRAVDLGFVSSQVGSDPDLLPLHGYPEFEAIVAEVKKRIGEE